VSLGLEKRSELLCHDLLQRIAAHGGGRRLVELVDQRPGHRRQQHRFIERHLDLDAAQRPPLPGELDVQAQSLLPTGMLATDVVLVGRDVEAPLRQQQIAAALPGDSYGCFECLTAELTDRREVEIFGVAVVGEVAFAKRGTPLRRAS
jgi:hypothetical protein